MKKIIYIMLAFSLCFTVVGCGKSKSKSNSAAYDDTKTYKTMDDIPMPNNYKTYSIEEASKQDWFSKVGVLGEERWVGATNEGYNKVDATFGFVDENTNLLVPDAIIYQYISHEQDDYGLAKQKILTKDMYVADNGYTFLKNILKFFGYDEDETNQIIQNKFALSMEQNEIEQALAAQFGKDEVDYVSGWHYNHIGPSVGFRFLSSMPDNDMLTTSFDFLQKTGELGRIIMYGFSVRGHIDRDYRIILVYDEVKANIVITMGYENNDDLYNSGKTFYEGTYVYYSDILDEDANNYVIENMKYIVR